MNPMMAPTPPSPPPPRPPGPTPPPRPPGPGRTFSPVGAAPEEGAGASRPGSVVLVEPSRACSEDPAAGVPSRTPAAATTAGAA